MNEKQLEEELTDMQPVFIVVVSYGVFLSPQSVNEREGFVIFVH